MSYFDEDEDEAVQPFLPTTLVSTSDAADNPRKLPNLRIVVGVNRRTNPGNVFKAFSPSAWYALALYDSSLQNGGTHRECVGEKQFRDMGKLCGGYGIRSTKILRGNG